MSTRSCRVLVLSRNYPNNVLERLGLWVKRLVHHCAETCETKVISPVPYCPPIFSATEYGRFRRIEQHHHEDGVEVFNPRFLAGPGNSLYHTEALSYYLGIRSLVKKLHQTFPFDLIHAHFTYPDGVVAARLGQQYQVPVIITEHALWRPNWMDKSALVRRQAVWAARQSLFQIAVSKALGETITHFTGLPDKIQVIPNGVESEIFKPLADRARLKTNQILYVGFINFNKGVDVLLKAMTKLIRQKQGIRLVLVGGSSYRNTQLQEDQIRRMAHDYGLDDHVEFVGPKAPVEVGRYMSESALLVLPSHKESFGSVLVEALACGTPVVATRSGGPEEIISEGVGLLVPKDDPDALAEAMVKVIKRRDQYDPAQLRRYALENFSWERIADQTVDLYQRAIGLFQEKGFEPSDQAVHV